MTSISFDILHFFSFSFFLFSLSRRFARKPEVVDAFWRCARSATRRSSWQLVGPEELRYLITFCLDLTDDPSEFTAPRSGGGRSYMSPPKSLSWPCRNYPERHFVFVCWRCCAQPLTGALVHRPVFMVWVCNLLRFTFIFWVMPHICNCYQAVSQSVVELLSRGAARGHENSNYKPARRQQVAANTNQRFFILVNRFYVAHMSH